MDSVNTQTSHTSSDEHEYYGTEAGLMWYNLKYEKYVFKKNSLQMVLDMFKPFKKKRKLKQTVKSLVE